MPYQVAVRAYFLDAQENEGYETFYLATQLTDAFDNMAAVMSEVDAINTQLEVLSAAAVTRQEVQILVPRSYSAPNEFANLGDYAFIRLKDDSTNENFAHQIPAPDMLLYDASADGLLDPAFQAAWTILGADLVHPETGNGLDFEYAQLRQRKRFRRLG